MNWLEARLERQTKLAAWQAADLAAYELGEDAVRRSVWWIEPSGERFSHERAVARCLMACGSGWRRVGLLLDQPFVRPLVRLGYRFVARIRRHLPGTTPACRSGRAVRVSGENPNPIGR